MLTFPHDMVASLVRRAWIAPMALWLQSEPITVSCCTHLGTHFSFIYHLGWINEKCGPRRGAVERLSYFILSSTSPAPAPAKITVWAEYQNVLGCSMEYQRRGMKVLRAEGDSLYLTPPHRHAHVHVDTHTQTSTLFLPWALRVSFRKEKVDKRVGAW